MRLPHLFHLTVLLVVLALAGCSGGPSSAPGDGGYDLKGKVVALDLAKLEVTLDHEAIPGLMKAMTDMPFRVADAKLLEGIKPGDPVQGRVKKTDSGNLITALHKSEGGSRP